MRDWFKQGRTMLGATALCASLAGCATQQDNALRLSDELARARADAAWQQAHAAELELRMSRLEQRAAAGLNAPSAPSAEERALVRRLDRLIEMNERLLAERAVAPAAALPPAATNSPTSSPTSDSTLLSEEQQLRSFVERLRGHPGSPHGGLTREQEAALRVLTRPERQLDAENPWPLAIY